MKFITDFSIKLVYFREIRFKKVTKLSINKFYYGFKQNKLLIKFIKLKNLKFYKLINSHHSQIEKDEN
jgi:hypothetical protein